jgi:hypothetical protein
MWIVVSLGIAALVRKLRRSSDEEAAEPASAPGSAPYEAPADDPADELRRKLADARDDGAPATDDPAEPEAGVDERRSEVHEEGRAAIDEMQRSTTED